VIRQAISCDVCGAEKKQTNHWFVACEQAGELRLSGWNSRMRQRAGTKHLCGQTCLHKLVDEFIARTIGGRAAVHTTEDDKAAAPRSAIDASLTSPAAYNEAASSARLITPAGTVLPATRTAPAAPAIVPPQLRVTTQPSLPVAIAAQIEEAPDYSSRRWRAEAWERERNRELRAVERHPEIARRRKGL
jgi:hypothetical protein